MRLWSIHPEYLDSKGLVALWREALLAQKVIQGKTRGYQNHPQLLRFRNTSNPQGAIASYLRYILKEADNRGYHFDLNKISNQKTRIRILVSDGQLKYEFDHLRKKLKHRAPEKYFQLCEVSVINAHPIFKLYQGSIEEWEVM